MPNLHSTQKLSTFLNSRPPLGLAMRQRIVEQALVIFERFYVHLPLKETLHAVAPIRRLKRMLRQLEKEKQGGSKPLADSRNRLAFHNELSEIFNSVRDRHMTYSLSKLFEDSWAYLGFQLEIAYENSTTDSQPRYIVSHLEEEPGFKPNPKFHPGVEVVQWNGIPIRRAVELNARRHAGSNPAARQARGLTRLTLRPLLESLPPDEDWVLVNFLDTEGKPRKLRVDWRVLTWNPAEETLLRELYPSSPAETAPDLQTALGMDCEGLAVRLLQRHVFVRSDDEDAGSKKRRSKNRNEILGEEISPEPKSWRRLFRGWATQDGRYGYLRIYTFDVYPDQQGLSSFLDAFAGLVERMPKQGLILDVRDNPGGLIPAAERLLQLFTPRPIEPVRFQYRCTPEILELCRTAGSGRADVHLDWSMWVPSIEQALATGDLYSHAFPITPPQACNDRGQIYSGPVVLITNALCYSATDIFAAGFQDHDIGPILGVDATTGAGGANVLRHGLLLELFGDSLPEPLAALPEGVELRVALRRALRVGKNEGTVLEDLGVEPEIRRRLTEDDVRHHNAKLLAEAIRILESPDRPADCRNSSRRQE